MRPSLSAHPSAICLNVSSSAEHAVKSKNWRLLTQGAVAALPGTGSISAARPLGIVIIIPIDCSAAFAMRLTRPSPSSSR